MKAPRIGLLRAAALALFFFLLAGAAAARFMAQRRGFARAQDVLSRYSIDRRRPAIPPSADLAPSWDWAAAIVGDAVLGDATEPVNLAKLDPGTRRLWLDAASRTADEIEAARVLMREAVAACPGWPGYHLLLGELTYAGMNRTQDVALAEHPERWGAPLRAASAAEPGNDEAATYLAGAYLETWQVVPESARPGAAEALRRAFRDADFVSRGLPPAIALLGASRALSLVPDDAAPLHAALQVLVHGASAGAAFDLVARLVRAERAARDGDLQAIESKLRGGSRTEAAALCARWMADHRLDEVDDAGGRRQIARLLELWPPVKGSWQDDPRGDIVRFLLNGRERVLPGRVLVSTLAALSDVPDSVRARAEALAGDVPAAWSVVPAGEVSREWVPVLARLAEAELERGNVAGAAEALRRVPRGSEGECDVLLVRRDQALAARNPGELSSVERELEQATAVSGPWSARGSLPLCLDPTRSGGRSIHVDLSVAADSRPAASGSSPSDASLVAYGWDGGLSGHALIRQRGSLSIPMTGLRGRHFLEIGTRVGPPMEVGVPAVR